MDGIFLADFQEKYTDVNSAWCRMLGMAREEIIGRTIMDLIPPEDADFSHSVCPTCMEAYYPDYAHRTGGTDADGR